jgi:hypothetical protein
MLEPRTVAALPTIYQSYKPVEEYLDFLQQAGRLPEDPAVVRPVDAIALGLFLAMSPVRPVVVDLACEVSGGVSTHFVRSQPRVREVISVRSPAQDGEAGWLDLLQEYQANCCEPSSLAAYADIHSEDAVSKVGRDVGATASLVVLLPTTEGSPDSLAHLAGRWLGLREDVVLVFLSLGEAGGCARLASLVSAFSGRSPHRLALLRDQTPAFHECQLGLVYDREHPYVGSILGRLRQLFTGNLSFLNLTKSACEAAIKAELVEPALRAQAADEMHKRKQAEEYYQARLAEESHRYQQLAAQWQESQLWRAELESVRGSLTYRLARRLSRARGLLAPRNTARYWVFAKMLRVLQVWKSAGLRGLASRAARKLIPQRKRAA